MEKEREKAIEEEKKQKAMELKRITIKERLMKKQQNKQKQIELLDRRYVLI